MQKLGMVAHVPNPDTRAEAGGSSLVPKPCFRVTLGYIATEAILNEAGLSLNRRINKGADAMPIGKQGGAEKSRTDTAHLTVPLKYCGGVLFCPPPPIRGFAAVCVGVCYVFPTPGVLFGSW